jgi:hypothetical protein
MSARLFWIQLAILVVAGIMPFMAPLSVPMYYGMLVATTSYMVLFRYAGVAFKHVLEGVALVAEALVEENKSLKEQLLNNKGTIDCENCLNHAEASSEEVQQ